VTQELTEQYLGVLGLPYVRIPAYVLKAAFGYRPGATGAELGAMRDASAYLKGLPDLIILDSAGRALAIELKTDTGKLSAAQRLWRAAIGTKTARSFEEAKAPDRRMAESRVNRVDAAVILDLRRAALAFQQRTLETLITDSPGGTPASEARGTGSNKTP